MVAGFRGWPAGSAFLLMNYRKPAHVHPVVAMRSAAWFTGDDGPPKADAHETGSAAPALPLVAEGWLGETTFRDQLVPTKVLFAPADVVLGGEPAPVARKILAKLMRHLGRAPSPDEIRAVMTHLHAQASELAAIAGTPEDRGSLINAAATAGAHVVEARAALKAAKNSSASEWDRLNDALSFALDVEAVATGRLRAI